MIPQHSALYPAREPITAYHRRLPFQRASTQALGMQGTHLAPWKLPLACVRDISLKNTTLVGTCRNFHGCTVTLYELDSLWTE